MELLIKAFKSTVLNMFNDLKETMGGKTKENKIMYEENENINKDTELRHYQESR